MGRKKDFLTIIKEEQAMKETTPSEECRYYENLIDSRLIGFVPPKAVGVAEKVFKWIAGQ